MTKISFDMLAIHPSISFLLGTNPDSTAAQEGSTANGSELSSPDATDGDASQSEAVIDELSESIKSEGDETLKDILDKTKEKKEVGARCVRVPSGNFKLRVVSVGWV